MQFLRQEYVETTSRAKILHTVIWLKLLFTAVCTIFLQTSLATKASVVITWNTKIIIKERNRMYASHKLQEIHVERHTPSMVAIFGWIIPEPFAMPPTLTLLPPT
jgi:hypothetical protein